MTADHTSDVARALRRLADAVEGVDHEVDPDYLRWLADQVPSESAGGSADDLVPVTQQQQARMNLAYAITQARDCGAITQTEMLALSIVPIGQGDTAAQLAVEALAALPDPDFSPDPEGAVAREVAPESDTATETAAERKT